MNLVGLKELSELLDVSYDTLKVWKNRNRLPDPFQVISGTPVWDWDESEEDFRSIQKNENSGRPRKPKISIAGGLVEIDLNENIPKKYTDEVKRSKCLKPPNGASKKPLKPSKGEISLKPIRAPPIGT